MRNATLGFRYSVKRIQTMAVAGDTEENWQRRADFAPWLINCDFDDNRTIFLDETGFNVSMRRISGRSLVGQPARVKVPCIRSKNISVMAAISGVGMALYKVLDGNGNAERFRQFIQELLLRIPANSTIVMDNASFHRNPACLDLIRASGHIAMFLPPYSPYFNPIEYLFSEWKHFVRSRAPTTQGELEAAIHGLNMDITHQHVHGYFRKVVRNATACLQGDRTLV